MEKVVFQVGSETSEPRVRSDHGVERTRMVEVEAERSSPHSDDEI